MNFLKITFACFLLAGIISCSENDITKSPAPDMPPYESMDIDFSKFQVHSKSADISSPSALPISNWSYSSIVVGTWSSLIKTKMAVPTAAFYQAFNNRPIYLEENKWQWSYEVPGFTSNYFAKLTGELSGSSIEWKMYISKEGINNSFEDFLWFTGISSISNTKGSWTLYHSPDFPEKLLEMQWEKEDENISKLTYTYVRLKDNEGEDDMFYGSVLEYGRQENEFDTYFKIDAHNFLSNEFEKVHINWNSESFIGQVKSPAVFHDEQWHCWDQFGEDIDCN